MTTPCLFLCAWATSSCIFKLRTARFELVWTLTVSLSPREKRNTQSKAGRVIWSSVLGAVAVQLASKFKIEGKLLSWKKSSNLLLHLTLL